MNTASQKERKENHTIDFLKLFFALCIVGIHTDLVKIFPSEHTQWYVMQVVFRMGVPFFFVVSGYFLGRKLWNCTDRKEQWHCVGIHYKIIAALSCMVDRKPDRNNSVMVSELRWRSESSAYDDH